MPGANQVVKPDPVKPRLNHQLIKVDKVRIFQKGGGTGHKIINGFIDGSPGTGINLGIGKSDKSTDLFILKDASLCLSNQLINISE